MSDENASDVGSVKVQVTPKAVFKAVRQILCEMKFDPAAVTEEVRKAAERQIDEKVIKYLEGRGYSEANLSDRVNRCLAALESKFEEYLRKAIEAKVSQFIEQNLKLTIDAVVRNSTFKLGWGYNAPVAKVTVEEEKK